MSGRSGAPFHAASAESKSPERSTVKTFTKDDRSEKQKLSFYWAAVAVDKKRSFCGPAKGGLRRCAWACSTLETAREVMAWIRTKSFLAEPILVDLRRYNPPPTDRYFRIYLCDGVHPSACSQSFAAKRLRKYTTKLAAASKPSDCITILNESGDQQLTLTQQEADSYSESSGYPVDQVSPDWIVFDVLMFVET